MNSPIIGALLTFLGGAAIAAVNYALNIRAIRKSASAFARVYAARQVLNSLYIVGVYFLSKVLPWDVFALLIGAAAGLTIPAFFFSARLVKLNDSLYRKKPEESGHGGDENG